MGAWSDDFGRCFDNSGSSRSRAVLEEKDGTKSYWALAHAADKPDFHHPDCFVAKLP